VLITFSITSSFFLSVKDNEKNILSTRALNAHCCKHLKNSPKTTEFPYFTERRKNGYEDVF
jgi:hypothetical protein